MSKSKTKIVIGKFYMAYGGTPHPAFVYEKTSHGTYLAIKVGTTGGKDMIEIKPTQEGYQHSFVNNRPFEGTRNDFGDREVIGLSFNESDIQTIELVKTHKSRKTRRAKQRYK